MTNSYRYAFAASVPSIATSGKPKDLGVGQIGVFDGKTWQATDGTLAKSILIAQGTPDVLFPQGVLRGNFTHKTNVLKGSQIKSFKKKDGQKGKNMVVAMGFDGVDTTKNLTVKKGDNFTFWLTLSGTPVAKFLGDSPKTHYAVWTEQFTTVLPCTDDCVDSCGESHDPNVVVDAVIDEINKKLIPGGQKLTDYIKVSKITECDTPSGLPTVSYTTYTLTIPDNGDQSALGAVQAQYPGVKVKRTKREGIYSTYEVVLLTSDGAPTAFSSVGLPIVPSCDTCPSGCPSGYTLQDAVDVWIVSRPISETTDLSDATARTAFADAVESAYSADASEFLSFNGATASVKLVFAAGTSVSALLADQVVLIDSNVAICTQTTPTTTSWVSCTTCTKAKKQFVISLLDSCDVDYLPLLQAEYGASNVALVSQNTDTCVSQYSLTVTSDNIDCDDCADVKWTFSTPVPFKGIKWTEVLGNNYGTDCVTGIRVESIYEQRVAKECFLNQVAYEYEPLFINISTRNPDPSNYKVLCETDVPVTVLQNVKYEQGLGRVVADHVIESMFNFNNPWKKNPAERDAFSYELGIDLNGIYDEYIIEFETYPDVNGGSHFGQTQVQTFEWEVFYPQGTGSDFETAISAFLASNSSVTLEKIGK